MKNWNLAHQNKKTTINVYLFVFLFWLIQNLPSKDPQTTTAKLSLYSKRQQEGAVLFIKLRIGLQYSLALIRTSLLSRVNNDVGFCQKQMSAN